MFCYKEQGMKGGQAGGSGVSGGEEKQNVASVPSRATNG